MRHARQGIIVLFGIALSGCQSDVAVERSVKSIPTKSKLSVTKPAANKVAKPIKLKPTYIDLGPIETVALPAVPVEVITETPVDSVLIETPVPKFERPISPSDAITAEQLRSSPDGKSDMLIDQATGALSDRCDPAYWGGQTPPANLGCDPVVDNPDNAEHHEALLPGTYIRLAPKPEQQVQDARIVARKIGDLDTKVEDDALGAVVLFGTRRQSRPLLIPAPDRIDEGRLPELPIENGGLPPSVLLPRSQ